VWVCKFHNTRILPAIHRYAQATLLKEGSNKNCVREEFDVCVYGGGMTEWKVYMGCQRVVGIGRVTFGQKMGMSKCCMGRPDI